MPIVIPPGEKKFSIRRIAIDTKGAHHRNTAREIALALLGAGTYKSYWPIDTAYSILNFVIREKTPTKIIVANRAHYSVYVEAGYPALRTRDSAKRTILTNMNRILRRASRGS